MNDDSQTLSNNLFHKNIETLQKQIDILTAEINKISIKVNCSSTRANKQENGSFSYTELLQVRVTENEKLAMIEYINKEAIKRKRRYTQSDFLREAIQEKIIA